MVWLYQHINEVRGHTQWGRMKNQILTAKRIGDYNAQQRRRDVEAGVAIMISHLEKARHDLLGAGGGSGAASATAKPGPLSRT
jgi:hypothetical protein